MSFAAEPYGVFVDDLVSALTGGVTREELVFLPDDAPFRVGSPGDFLPSTIRIHGLVGGAFFRFRADVDFQVSADGTITFREGDPGVPAAGARWPDRGSHFYLSYERKPELRPTPLLTDRNPGSVVRTLAESFAREYAVISKQLERVYRAGFLETAEGRDLDQVVALVGVARRTRAFASGEVVFSRTTPAPADIFVPEGTLVSTGEAPPITVETIEDRTLRAGTVSVAAPVQSLAVGADGVAQAGTLTVIHRPILGIDAASNPQAMTFGGEDEADEALRRRADRALESGGRATAGALIGALMSAGIREQDVRVAEDHVAFPGVVKLTIAGAEGLSEAERRRLVDLINDARPAGVRVLHNVSVPPAASLPPSSDSGGAPPGPLPTPPPTTTEGTTFPIGAKAVVTPASAALTAAQKAALETAVREAIQAAVDRYGLGQTVVYNALVAAAMSVEGVYDVSLDLFPSGADPAVGRTNLVPQPPETRPALAASDLVVTLRGALIALDVTADIQRLGLAASADRATALAAARDDIAARLSGFVTGPTRPATIDVAALQAFLTDTPEYSVNSLSYTAEFLDDGLRVLRQNVAITPEAEQQLWIRAVTVIEGVTS